MQGKSLTITLGFAAGAALTALAVSKSGQRAIKLISLKTAELKSQFEKDITQISRSNSHFI